jgi:hypothetical protein
MIFLYINLKRNKHKGRLKITAPATVLACEPLKAKAFGKAQGIPEKNKKFLGLKVRIP